MYMSCHGRYGTGFAIASYGLYAWVCMYEDSFVLVCSEVLQLNDS